MNKAFAFLGLALNLLTSCGTGSPDNVSRQTDSLKTEASSSFEAFSLTVESGQRFDYFLYTPEEAKENLPLILYLHGGSGKPESEEGDLNLLVAGDGLPKFVQEERVEANAYIAFPQLPYGKKGWSDVKASLLEFVSELSERLNIDSERISITGHSMGGKGTWDIALSYPELFYKVSPLSGNVTTSETNLRKLMDKPVWAFVGEEDTIVDPQSSIDFIASLSKINNQAKITIIEGYGHFDVPNVYLSNEYNLLSWLTE